MIPYDNEINDYGFQESNISGGQFNVDIPIWEPITIAPFSFDAINAMNTVVYPVVNDYSFEEAYISGGQVNVAIPAFEPIKIAPISFENMNPIMTLSPVSSYFPITQPIFTTPIPVAPVFTNTMKITVRANVLDEYGDPLPIANISIDGKATAQTNYDGNFTIPNVLPTSIVRVTYMGMGDYAAVASQFPSKIQLKTTAIQLEGVTIIVPKKDTVVPFTAPVAKANMNWLLWVAVLAAGYKGMQYFKDDKPKTVKAKI